MVHADIWFDGACSGNPGPMGAGALVVVGGTRFEVAEPGGVGTNNEAEYLGAIAGMKKALDAGATTATVRGDSQLVLRQLEGRYAVKAANLKRFYQEAKALLDRFDRVSLEWVPRDQNAAADALARQGAGQR